MIEVYPRKINHWCSARPFCGCINAFTENAELAFGSCELKSNRHERQVASP